MDKKTFADPVNLNNGISSIGVQLKFDHPEYVDRLRIDLIDTAGNYVRNASTVYSFDGADEKWRWIFFDVTTGIRTSNVEDFTGFDPTDLIEVRIFTKSESTHMVIGET